MRAVTIDSDLATLFTFTSRKPRITPIQEVRYGQRAGSLPGCNPCSALCCESSGNQQLSGPPGAGVLPATNQLTGERSEPKSWGQIGAVNVV